MNRVIAIILLSAFFVGAETVSLSGTVKKTGGTVGLAGVRISLSKLNQLTSTTGTDGSFVISGTTLVQSRQKEVSSFQFNLKGNCITFAPVSREVAGSLDVFSSTGKRIFSTKFFSRQEGRQSIALPVLSSGIHLLRVITGGKSFTGKLVCIGKELFLEDKSLQVNAVGNTALQKQAAAAAVDTLIASKDGYIVKKVAIEKYTMDNIAITLDTNSGMSPVRPTTVPGSPTPDNGTDGSARIVAIDANQTIGTIRSLLGAHHDPGAASSTLGKAYTDMGVDMMRTHDAVFMGGSIGAGDIDGASGRSGVMFPKWEADATVEASYNFGPTDKVIENMRAIGAEVYFRIGRSAEGAGLMSGSYKNNYVPKDAAKYAEIAKRVVMHYNQGWAKGFKYGIRFFEIWNEPDFVPFWAGTAAEYYELYGKVAAAIKSVDSSLLVGGPTNMSFNDKAGMRASFIKYVKDNKLPLDFFSFHRYTDASNDPFDFVRVAQGYRDELDQSGFTQTLLVNSEWEISLVPEDPMLGGDAGNAAFSAAGLIYMQDAPVDRAMSYMNISSTLSKENHAFQMVATLKATPVRLKVQGSHNEGFAVLAGRSDAKQELRVIIANYKISPVLMGPVSGGNEYVLKSTSGTPITLTTFTLLDRRTITYPKREGYALTITNVPESWGDVTVKQYRIDAGNDMKLMNTTVSKAADRAKDGLKVSGSWVHAKASPPNDPDGADQGVDLIVVTGPN